MKNKKWIYFAAILACFSPVIISAQEASESSAGNEVMQLTPDKAVELAVKNNLGLESSRTALETKKRASKYSWNQFIPQVSVSPGLNMNYPGSKMSGLVPLEQIPLNPLYTNPLTGDSLLPPGVPDFYGVVPYSMELPQWSLFASFQASLALSAAMFENIRRLRLDYETGLITYDKAKAQLERDVLKAYYDILLLQENIALLLGSIANVERSVQIAQANYNAGLVPELTLLQARVQRENMRPMLYQAENGLVSLKELFSMQLGLDSDTVFELVPLSDTSDIVSLNVKEMISKAAANKPDILELKQTILMLESVRKTQINALTPTLIFNWSHNSAYVLWKKDERPENIDKWNNSGSFQILFRIQLDSLIPWSANFQGIKNTEDQIKSANIGLAQMIRGTEIEVQNIVLSLDRTHSNMQALAQNVSLAEQSYRLMEQAYRAGLQDYFQVQNSELSLRQARNNLLEQQFTYLKGLIDLEYAIGVPFGTLSKRSE